MGTPGHKFIKKNTCAHRNEIFFLSALKTLGIELEYSVPKLAVCAAAHHEGMAEGRRGFGGVWLFLIPPD